MAPAAIVAILALAGLLLAAKGPARTMAALSGGAEACAFCHVMEMHEAAWRESGHRAKADCNACHLPTEPLARLAAKVENGARHGFFTLTGAVTDPALLAIRAENRRIVETSCRTCHTAMAADEAGHGGKGVACLRCHDTAGHDVPALLEARKGQGG